jgi:2-octaprenyl-6-methoxyphenol hydroxylase
MNELVALFASPTARRMYDEEVTELEHALQAAALARAEGAADAGDAGPLEAYADWRAEDRRRIVSFTDGLVRLFGSPLGVLRGLRSVGLLAFDSFPPAKSAMARLSVGAAGRIPRLARGVPLAGDR